MNSPLAILMVEDDDVAIESATRQLRKNNIHFPIFTAKNGKEGLAMLRGENADIKLPRELIVLLDLNMPVMNGFEFLQELRNDPKLRPTVVFVLTTSDSDADRTKAYHNIIAGYMVKSSVAEHFANLANLLEVYDASVKFA